MDHGSATVHGCIKSGVGRGFLKSGGVGWVLNRCGLWWVVVALGLRIVVDRCVNRSGGGVEISLFFG